MSLPEPPAPGDQFFSETVPAKKKAGLILLPLIFACVAIGFAAGYLISPSESPTPLSVLHERTVAGCVPVQYAFRDDLSPAAARELADAQIQGARALGYTNAGYLVTKTKDGVAVTMYVEKCEGA